MNPTITVLKYPQAWSLRIPIELVPAFQHLINRALNVNSDCHPEMKVLADVMEVGAAKQDYYHSRSDIKRKFVAPGEDNIIE